MTPGNPTRTIHFVIADALDRRMGRHDRPLPHGLERLDLRHAVTAGDPDRRDFYAVSVATAWFTLGFACFIGMVVIGIAFDVLLSDRAGDYAVGVLLSLALFCCAGGVTAVWRLYRYVPQARRRLREHGADSEEFAQAMRRTLPRNSSLVFQTAVAAIAFILAVG